MSRLLCHTSSLNSFHAHCVSRSGDSKGLLRNDKLDNPQSTQICLPASKLDHSSKTDFVCGHIMYAFVGDELPKSREENLNSILKLFKI